MPRIFLSPSLQPYNEYYGSGNEQEYMNKLADAMIPYLRTNGIQYTRHKIGPNVGQSIRDSNAGYYDLHLALHSNACLLYTSPSPRDRQKSRMPSSA